MCKYGVYAFKLNGRYIYIGKDSNIDQESRFKQHLKPSRKYLSKINTYLQQDNPKWEYLMVAKFKYKKHMNQFEILLIKQLKPKYNVIHNKKGEK